MFLNYIISYVKIFLLTINFMNLNNFFYSMTREIFVPHVNAVHRSTFRADWRTEGV